MSTISTVGVSDEAVQLKESYSEYQNNFERVASNPRSEVSNRILDIFQECGRPNWGGEQEQAVERSTLALAGEFIRALPKHVKTPELYPEPDGSVELEWYLHARRTISISIDCNGLVSWAALYGHNSQRGSFNFSDGRIPEEIERLVSKVGQHAPA